MRFRLRTLLIVAAIIPPVVWFFVKVLRHSDEEYPEPILDPFVLFGVVAWIALYYHLVHKRLPKVTPSPLVEPVAESGASDK